MELRDIPDTLAPKVAVHINGVPVPVSQLSLNHTIGQLPFAIFETQLDNQSLGAVGLEPSGVVKLDLALFNQLNAGVQNRLLNKFRLTPDTEIRVNDGRGQQLVFKGHLGRPEFNLVNGALSLRFTCVHPGANLQAFNPSIYYLNQPYKAEVTDAFFEILMPPPRDGLYLPDISIYQLAVNSATIPPQPRTDSVTDRLAVIALNMLVRRNNVTPANASDYFYNAWPLHNLNKLVWPYFKEVMQTSRELTAIHGLSSIRTFEIDLNTTLYQALMESTNAWEMLQRVQQMFYFQINAGWDSPLRLEHSLTQAPVDERVIRAPADAVRFSMANLFELPVIQAVMHANVNQYYAVDGRLQGMPGVNQTATAEQMGKGGPNILVGYPAKVASDRAGVYYIVEPPAWIGRSTMTALNGTNISDGIMPSADPADRMKQVSVITRGMIKDLDDQQNRRLSMFRYYAQRAYGEYYLSGTSASVSVPLTAASNLEVGRTYSVETLDKAPLFTGYLASVDHQIQVQNEGGSATTFLNFSHVKVQGVELVDHSKAMS